MSVCNRKLVTSHRKKYSRENIAVGSKQCKSALSVETEDDSFKIAERAHEQRKDEINLTSLIINSSVLFDFDVMRRSNQILVS